jgi:hypothetical protein
LDEKSRKQVVDQRREGKTIRQIAKNTGKSTRTVITILKDEELGEIEAELRVKEKEKSDVKQTNYTKALRQFSKGKSVLDVTIKLGITSNEAKMAYIDFRDSQTCDQFGKDYNQFKEYLPALLPLHEMCMDKGLNSNDVFLAIEYAKNRSKAEVDLQMLSRSIIALQIEEKTSVRKVLPSIIQLARRLPVTDPEGSLLLQNLKFKMSVSKVVDELGL